MTRRTLAGLAASLAIAAGAASASAQVGTAFTYQGQLQSSGAPVNSNTDLQFSLWTAATGGSQVGSTVTTLNTAVSNGLFSASVDFGVNPYTADQALWLQIAVRNPAGSGSYVQMGTRQRITAAPFSMATRGISAASSGAIGIGGAPFDADRSLTLHAVNGGSGETVSFYADNGHLWDMTVFNAVGTFGDFTLSRSGLDFPFVIKGDTGNILLNGGGGGGRVGIGTSSPGTALHVRQASDANGTIRIDSGVTSAQYSIVGFADRGTQIWSCGLRPDGMFGIDRDGTNTFLQISQDGLIGMGGAVPTAGRAINVQGGAYCTGSVWTNACDKNLKEDFTSVDPQQVLDKVVTLPISTWRYKHNDKLHMGPTAQDFRAAFGLGENDTSIGTVDADGVSLAAIKGLNAKLTSKDREIADLRARLERLEALVSSQAAKAAK